MKIVDAINSKLKDSLQFRLVLFSCAILLIIIREPSLIIHPRLWAEEGCLFYQFAYHHSLYEIFTTAHVGYLTLFNSIVSALQAKVFSVESAATVSTYMGFLVQLIPVYIIAFTHHSFWNNAFKKAICALMIIVLTAPELWLNTTNSHFIFGLITFLILVASANNLSRFQKYFFRLLLFMGGLTGPASIFFTPMFLLKSYREKNKEKYIQTGIITICAIVQAFVIVYSILFDNKYKRLSEHNLLKTIQAFFVDNFSLCFPSDRLHINLFFALIIFFVFIYLFVKNRKKTEFTFFLMSFILVAVFSTLGSLNMAGSPRYAYIPSCILSILLLSECFGIENSQNKTRYIAPTIITFCLVLNTLLYKHTIKAVYSPYLPKWKNEVANWRKDSTIYPTIPPGNDLKVRL